MPSILRDDQLIQKLKIQLRAQDSYIAFKSAQSTVQVREVLLWYSDYAIVAGTVADDFPSVGPANPDGDCLICVPFMDILTILTSIEYRNLVLIYLLKQLKRFAKSFGRANYFLIYRLCLVLKQFFLTL
jgi:hypothetical protein